MSQHTCSSVYTAPSGKEFDVEVQMGWDKVMQRFYLVVDLLNEEDELVEGDVPSTGLPEEGIVYSNLCDEAPNKNLSYFRVKLIELGVSIPNAMFIECSRDGDANTGNRECQYPSVV